MKFTLTVLLCIFPFLGCEDTKTNSTNNLPIEYSTVKGFVYDKATGDAIIYGYHLNTVYIKSKNGLFTSSAVSSSGTYELQNIENEEKIIFTICTYYEDFSDTVQVSGSEYLFDIWLERKEE